LSELSRWFNWERTGDDSGAQCAAVWKDVMLSIDWSDMSCCCGNVTPTQYRYTAEGVLQLSEDAGVTWTDAPQFDTRNNSPEFPPISGDDGDDKKCQAAAGAALLVKEQVGDQLTDDMGRYTLLQLITDWVTTMVNSSNPFEALLTVVANQIFALIIATLRPALTDTVYDLFRCALYCNMADDASFDDSQWAAARDDITAMVGGIAGIFLEHLVYLLGSRGLTNLVRSAPVSDADCADCSCSDCTMFGWMTDAIGGGSSISITGNIIELDAVPESGHYAATIWFRAAGDTDASFDANKCGKVVSWTIVSGTHTDQQGQNDCGTATNHYPITVDGIDSCQVYWRSSVPFRVRAETCNS